KLPPSAEQLSLFAAAALDEGSASSAAPALQQSSATFQSEKVHAMHHCVRVARPTLDLTGTTAQTTPATKARERPHEPADKDLRLPSPSHLLAKRHRQWLLHRLFELRSRASLLLVGDEDCVTQPKEDRKPTTN